LAPDGNQASFRGLLLHDEFVASAAVNVVSLLKGLGYLVSTVSVLLLGILSWKSASEQPLLLLCLILGMLASITGMGLRWMSHRLEQKKKPQAEAGDFPGDGAAVAAGRRAKA
jgi:hypothetical protein